MSGAAQILRADEADASGFDFVHSIQHDAACRIVPLSRAAGLDGIAVNLVTIQPGGQAFPHHRHHSEDEWTYIVSGSARVRLGETEHDAGPGDFVAYPAGGDAHSVRNASLSEPLVCLMGGAPVPADLVDFPELGKRIVKSRLGVEAAEASAFSAFSFRAPPAGEDA